MRKGFLGSIAGLFAGTALSLAQAPLPTGPVVTNAGQPVVTTVAAVEVQPVSPYVSATPLMGVEMPVSAPSSYGCPNCGGGHGLSAPADPCASPYMPSTGVVGPPCLHAEPTPTPYLPRPCPTQPTCACKPAIPYAEPSAHCDMYVTGGMEYLLWWVKSMPVTVPLVTSAPGATLPVLSDPSTSVLAGNKSTDYGTFSGARLFLDFWHDQSRDAGVDVSAFGLLQRTKSFSTGSDAGGNPAIGVPFFNPVTNKEAVSLVSFPGAFSGTATVKTGSDIIGIESNLLWRAPVMEHNGGGIWLVGGFRFIDLSEDLALTQSSTILPGALGSLGGTTVVLQGGISGPPAGVFAPTAVQVIDQFKTRNEFFGGQFGVQSEFQRGDAFVGFTGKIGLGINHEILQVNGSTGFSGGGPAGGAGGLFAVSSNLGQYTRNWFCFVPEVGVKAGYYLTPHIRGYVGYDFLYMSDVFRPGDQIDRVVSPALVPSSLLVGAPGGPQRPMQLHNESSYWAQGVTFGLDFSY